MQSKYSKPFQIAHGRIQPRNLVVSTNGTKHTHHAAPNLPRNALCVAHSPLACSGKGWVLASHVTTATPWATRCASVTGRHVAMDPKLNVDLPPSPFRPFVQAWAASKAECCYEQKALQALPQPRFTMACMHNIAHSRPQHLWSDRPCLHEWNGALGQCLFSPIANTPR